MDEVVFHPFLCPVCSTLELRYSDIDLGGEIQICIPLKLNFVVMVFELVQSLGNTSLVLMPSEYLHSQLCALGCSFYLASVLCDCMLNELFIEMEVLLSKHCY